MSLKTESKMEEYDFKIIFVVWQVFLGISLAITVAIDHWLALGFALGCMTTLLLQAYNTYEEWQEECCYAQLVEKMRTKRRK